MMHPAGPFTSKLVRIYTTYFCNLLVFFSAPTFKWMITFSNIGDLNKPAELISANQQIAIFLTGVLWTRYSFVVVPVNYNLAIANVFMGASAAYQLYRKM